MSFLDGLFSRAGKLGKVIALAEGEDKRVAKAAEILTQKQVCKVVLIGDKEKITKQNPDINFDGVMIENPHDSAKTEGYSEQLYNLRKDKGMTLDSAKLTVESNSMYYGCMALKLGDIDGLVGGAVFSSAQVARAAFQIIKAGSGINSVSSCFVMVPPENFKYSKTPYIFSDCAVIPYPEPQQLADIAYAAYLSAVKIVQLEPKLALLSFSTKGSANHPSCESIRESLKIINERHPYIEVDGEMQLDAAIVEAIGQSKAPGSTVAGRANVLIFPNLDAGNIGYKLAQRMGNFMAIGPIMQGLAKPVNDLSRGCTTDDIVAVAAITALQSK